MSSVPRGGGQMGSRSGYRQRWPEGKTFKLIRAKIKCDHLFTKKLVNFRKAWEAVRVEAEIEEDIIKCRKTWNNLLDKYKKILNPPTGAGTSSVELASSWPYFDELHSFLQGRHSINPPLAYESENPVRSTQARQNNKDDTPVIEKEISPSGVSNLSRQRTESSTVVESTMSCTAVSEPTNRSSTPIADLRGTNSTPLPDLSCSETLTLCESRISSPTPGPSGLQSVRRRKLPATTSAQKRANKRSRDEMRISMLKTEKIIRKACKAFLALA